MNITRDYPQFIRENKSLIRKELFLRIAELINSATSVTEKQRFTISCCKLLLLQYVLFCCVFSLVDIYDGLNESLKAVDSVLYTEVRADIEKDLNSESNRAYQKSSKDILGGPLDQVGLLQENCD